MTTPTRGAALALALYRLALRAHPPAFRRRFEAELVQVVADALADARGLGGAAAAAAVLGAQCADAVASGVAARLRAEEEPATALLALAGGGLLASARGGPFHDEPCVPDRITLGRVPDGRCCSIGVAERRTHLHLIGPPGCGKSTLLLHMLLQDIEAGRGVAVIEPKGDLIDDLLRRLPLERAQDVVLLRAEDRENPLGCNVLDCLAEPPDVGGPTLERLLELLLGGVNTPAPRAGRYLEWGIRTVRATTPGATLHHVGRFFADEGFRLQTVEALADDELQARWREVLQNKSAAKLAEEFDAVRTRLAKWLGDPYFCGLLCQPATGIDFRRIMDQGGIFLAQLPTIRPVGPALSRFVGELLLSRFIGAAFARQDVPEDQRPDFPLYLDEFQHYLLPDLKDVLEMGRSYHFSLILSHQYGAQVAEHGVLESILGNVRNNVVFNLEERDAGLFERVFGGAVSRAQFRLLRRYHAYTRLNGPQGVTAPFLLTTLPPDPPRDSD